MRVLFGSLFFFAIGLMLTAQEVQKDSITQLEEVIITDALKRKNATGIVPFQTIGAETFDNYSPVDVVSAMNQISGVYILSGALNTNRITIRGVGARTLFGTDKLRLYFNEIPVTNGTGSSTIEAYDLESLNDIEVIKGPKGTAFGANLGGAIILNSKEGSTGSFFSNNVTIGSYNLLKNALSFSHADEKFSMGLQYGHMETEGYRENSQFDRDGVLITASYLVNARSSIGLLVNHIDYKAHIASSLGETAFRENSRQAAFTWRGAKGFEDNNFTLLGLSYTHTFGAHLEGTTSIFYSYLDHFEPRPFGILDEFTNGFGFRTRFFGDFKVSNTVLKYSFGAELVKDEYTWREFLNLYQQNNGNGSLQGDLFADNKEFRRQFNTFASLTVPLSATLVLQPGVSINKTHYDFRDLFNTGAGNRSAERNFDAIVAPSLTLNFTPADAYRIYANVSRGFSNPSLEETLTPDGVINPDIAQEKGTNYEIGTHLFLADGKLNLSGAIYQMNINDLLVADRVGDDQFVGKNAGKTRHRGLEADVNYRMDLPNKWRVSPFISYTFSDHIFVDFVDGANDFSGNPLTGVPKHRVQSGIRLGHEHGFYWNSTHQFVSKISLLDAHTLYSDPFNVFNTRMGYIKEFAGNMTLRFDFGINNVFNTKYAQSVLINTAAFGGAEPRFFYPGNGINYYGSIGLRYAL
ncbi:TonB-dependent receptor [Arenibacter sp. GZD96]|uniref:TonB-dependent receptor family protein n=1 Tax=Aurantibrevibacter litoralis TaxID=3106030 RepID=UPI002B00167A|nr:TonB-dependent receptor [Arenibacter sp. GZD-96]MEA1785632.1 TonB-dependent receptor [Arenibacter sp. GZD-96]